MGDEGLNFNRVEPAGDGATTAMTCTSCGLGIAEVYYACGQHVLCEGCKPKLEAALAPEATGGGSRFLKALGLGSAAALAGSLVYFAISKATGYELALITIGIGMLVGRAVRAGGGGRGGRRYQVLAAGLTYLSVVGIYVPSVIDGMVQPQTPVRAEQGEAPAPDDAVAVPVRAELDATPGAGGVPTAAEVAPPTFGEAILGLALFLGLAVGVAMVAPFLGGAENLLGLLIIAFGVWEAWRVNQPVRLVFTGPLRVGGAPPP